MRQSHAGDKLLVDYAGDTVKMARVAPICAVASMRDNLDALFKEELWTPRKLPETQAPAGMLLSRNGLTEPRAPTRGSTSTLP
jgi:hypothetical protein